jgi:mono/diheme cytochrome c family protein
VTTRATQLLRLSPFGTTLTLALLASACGSVTDDGADSTTPIPAAPVADTCADNPLLAGCTPTVSDTPVTPVDPGTGSDATSLAKAAAENVLAANCGQCHGPALTAAQAKAGMNYINDIDKLVSTGKIVPLNSAGSLIIQRMQKGEMPPIDSGLPRVTDSDIAVVAQYIDNPVFWPEYTVKPVCLVKPVVDFDVLYREINVDIQGSRSQDAKFFRYITLTNRSAGICDSAALDHDRQALTKMLNMLSTQASLGAPTPIDADQTVFRVDLRDFNWDRNITVNGQRFNDVWDAIADANPYAVPFEGRDADSIKRDTGANVPVMYGDQMLHVATVGDLYYAIIDVDTNRTLGDFIDNVLKIDVQGDIEDGDAMRAGTTKSRVSRQDRVVERHDMGARAGVLWQSFDFQANAANQSIFQDPFGINPGGTEAIFTLPNGMLGYIIADGNDRIVNDSNILLDTSQADFRAVTSVSCSNCHALGFIPVVDEVRDFTLTNSRKIGISRNEIEQIQDIYVAPDVFAAQVADDTKGFYQNALTRSGLPAIGGDPVSSLFLQFEGDVNLDTAAADMGLDSATLKDNLQLLDPVLAVLGAGGTLDRDDFTQVYVASVCRMSTLLENQPNAADCDRALGAVNRRGR